MMTQVRSNIINAISNANTEAYEKLSPIPMMKADGLTLSESFFLMKKVFNALNALNALGEELGKLDK